MRAGDSAHSPQEHFTLVEHPSPWAGDRRGDACVAPAAAIVGVALTAHQHHFARISSFSLSISVRRLSVKCSCTPCSLLSESRRLPARGRRGFEPGSDILGAGLRTASQVAARTGLVRAWQISTSLGEVAGLTPTYRAIHDSLARDRNRRGRPHIHGKHQDRTDPGRAQGRCRRLLGDPTQDRHLSSGLPGWSGYRNCPRALARIQAAQTK